MTSTTSKWGFTKLDWAFVSAKLALLAYAAVLLTMAACNDAPSQPSVKTRIATPAVQEEQPKQDQAAPEPPKKEPPYFGSTYEDGMLTSVYYYPGESKDDPPMTHLKFDHREDDIYLCGDQRRSFEPGTKYRLLMTFEPNAPCITNWKVK